MNRITAIARDPLLAIAKAILYFLMGAMALGIVGCVVGLGVLLLMRDRIIAGIATEMDAVSVPHFVTGITAVMPFAILLLLAVIALLFLLKRIVDTVGAGDPFVPENAVRLTRMAWLSLVIQVITIPLSAIGVWLDKYSDEPSARFHVDSGLSGNGLLLMLVLFILARVFRKGAEMRAELEGTV